MTGDTHFTQEETMVQEIKQGNEQALAEFYRSLYHRLLYFTDQLIKDPHEAHSIVTNAFMTLWKLKANMETMDDFRAMLYNFCRLRAYDFNTRDRKKKGVEILAEDIQQYSKGIILDDVFANQINQAEIMYELDRAIDLLPDRQREVIRLILQNKNSTEIGAILSISPSTTRVLRQRAVQSLKQHLLKQGLLSAFCIQLLVDMKLWID